MGKNTAITIADISLKLDKLEKKIDRLNKQANLDKEYLSTREACQYLSCQRTMLWKLVKAGKLSPKKMENKRTYYALSELKSLIEVEIAA